MTVTSLTFRPSARIVFRSRCKGARKAPTAIWSPPNSTVPRASVCTVIDASRAPWAGLAISLAGKRTKSLWISLEKFSVSMKKNVNWKVMSRIGVMSVSERKVRWLRMRMSQPFFTVAETFENRFISRPLISPASKINRVRRLRMK